MQFQQGGITIQLNPRQLRQPPENLVRYRQLRRQSESRECEQLAPGGVFMKDEDIQIEDIRSLALDVTDFMAAIARKYQPKN